jgi:hypothetical protein
MEHSDVRTECSFFCVIANKLTQQQICCNIKVVHRKGQKIMNRTFIEVPQFTKKWKELGLSDENCKTYY